MVEMRWVKKQDDYYHNGLPISKGPVYEVFQYRYRNSSAKYGNNQPMWSEWTDVPTVTE